jgi:Zn-dependent protease with chaperone function
MEDDSDDDEGGLVILVVGILVLYAVTEMLLLAVGRSREYDADRWAFEQIGHAEPLVGALIVVTHAADEADAAVERRRAELAGLPRKERRKARRALRPASSTAMVRALALAHPTRTDSNVALRAMSPADYRQYLRDDADRRRWYHDLFATHPPLSLRVRALSTHGASVTPAMPVGDDQRRSLRQRSTMSSASKRGS